ncbi:MAG TPA: DUF5591 domain-containing protein, partial [Candidatus Sulfotelmatobacter sp.]|nr:DUF5591 domain-containing protein [Candidatus Sulfotelmatobacter sp.]
RPEIGHHRRQLCENYVPPATMRTLFLCPQTRSKPFHKAKEYQKIRQLLKRLSPQLQKTIHVCFYDAPLGIIPLELDEVYPLSQHETAIPFDKGTIEYVANQVADYVRDSKYSLIVLFDDTQNWSNNIRNAVRRVCSEKNKQFKHISLNVKRQKTFLTQLELILNKNLKS